MPASPLCHRLAAALSVLLLASLLPVAAASAAAAAPVEGTSGRVLLQLDTPFTPPGLLTAAARSRQSDRLDAVRDRALARITASGARTLRTYGLPFVSVEASPAALSRLRAAPEVAAVLPDRMFRPSLDLSVPHVGAPAAWSAGYDGTGQTVAVLDTGVDASHVFLAGKVIDEACFAQSSTCPNGQKTQLGAGAAAPCTYDTKACPHGTHVAGIAAGSGSQLDGVARRASIAAVQVFSQATTGCPGGATSCAVGYSSDLLAGLDHIAKLASTRPVAAVNLSLGGGSYTGACDTAEPAYKTAIDALRSLGVATLAATGNAGSLDAISAPACVSSAIAVGSTSLTDVVSSFSNSSSQLAVLAPGEAIYSSLPGGLGGNMSGTSQATPHVAGAVAVLKQKRPTASVSEILTALTTSGVPVTDTRNGRTTPRLQVDAALTALAVPAATAPSPSPSPSLSPSPSPSPSLAPSPSPSPSLAPSPSPSPSLAPSPSPSPSLAPSPSPSPSLAPSPSPSPSPSAEPAPAPVVAPSPSVQPSPSPSVEPAPVLVVAPVPVAEPAPSTEASPAPALEPSPTPIQTPVKEPTAEPVLAPSSTRLSGADRYDTAAQTFSAAFDCAQGGAASAVLARGDAFADALAGSYLAGGNDTGVLLTATGSVPAATLSALRGSGARTVYLLGGTSAISNAVAAQLAGTRSSDCDGLLGGNLQVVRISGANRFDTARRTAEHAGPSAVGTADLTGQPLRTAIVASGLGFADALAAGPLSYSGAADPSLGNGLGFPTLLTGTSVLAPEAAAGLKALGIQQVIIPGGTAVVSPAVESSLKALGLRVVRLAGSNRTETAALVASFAVQDLGFATTGVALARGDAFADALAGAAYAGDRGLPLLLTAGPTTLSDATRSYLQGARGQTGSVTGFGGIGAISSATLQEAVQALTG